MAPAINTTDDLIRLLTENAEFYQAVRRLILTDELIQLPERFAAFANRVDGFITEQRGINEEQRGFNEEQRVFNEEQRAFNEEQRGFNRQFQDFITEQRGINEEQRGFNEEQRGFNEEQRVFNEEQRAFNEEQRGFNRRIQDDIGALKGNAARTVINAHLYEIAAHLGLTLQSTLLRRELGELIGPQGRHADISSGDRASFIRADLVAIAADTDGDACNIALEASYTGDIRDTRRARRNAELLERLTGRRTHAMIASVRNDRDTQAEIDRGAVAWYPLDPDDFTPE